VKLPARIRHVNFAFLLCCFSLCSLAALADTPKDINVRFQRPDPRTVVLHTTRRHAVTDSRDATRPQTEKNLARRNLWLPIYNRNLTPLNPSPVHVGTLDSQVNSLSVELPPDWQAKTLIENEDQKAATNLVAKERTITLEQGSLLLCPKQILRVKEQEHNFVLPSDAVSYMLKLGDEVAVFNLAGRGRKAISCEHLAGGPAIKVETGQAIFLSKSKEFAGAKLANYVRCYNHALVREQGGLYVHRADFLYHEALDHCPQFQKCLHSSDNSERALSNKLLKLSAARIISFRD
jgi:hypothetical protein